MRVIDAVVLCTFGAFVFWGWAALASLDCCSFSFLVLAFVGALQLYTGSSSTCPSVAETLNAIPGVSGVDCWVRTLSVVLLLRTFVVGGGVVLAAFC